MFTVTISRELVLPDPAQAAQWDAERQCLVNMIGECWRPGHSVLVIVRLGQRIVALALVDRRPGWDLCTLDALVSVCPGAGSLALGRARALAKADHLRLEVYALRESEKFYQRCGLREVQPLQFWG